MGALTPEVVVEALRIQETLLGPGISCTMKPENGKPSPRVEPAIDYLSPNPLSNTSSYLPPGVFFHSPLIYWNCSLSSIQKDTDLLETVNANAMRVSPLNMTLHYSSVFAGKTFSHHRLAAADALVISVFYDVESKMGELWDQRAAALASDANFYGNYDIYPSNGRVLRNTFYEVCHNFLYMDFTYILSFIVFLPTDEQRGLLSPHSMLCFYASILVYST